MTASPTPLERIRERRQRLGPSLVILAHHYQSADLKDLADHVGDSFELSRQAADSDALLVAFCGVRFMAEAARVLVKPEARVFLPAPEATCPMAEMITLAQLEEAFGILEGFCGEAPVPVCYMNSNADVKAFCGEHGGCVCTSSNADRAVSWARAQGRRVLFVPDEFLGRNTALRLGLEAPLVFDPRLDDGGLSADVARAASLFLWKGFCHVHVWFKPRHVHAARLSNPAAKVLVHPECSTEVTALADGVGSTSYMVKTVREAVPGSAFFIGTELNLVRYLARECPDRTVLPLDVSMCPNMARVTLEKLAVVLEDWPAASEVLLPQQVVSGARLSLERMLRL